MIMFRREAIRSPMTDEIQGLGATKVDEGLVLAHRLRVHQNTLEGRNAYSRYVR